MRQKPFFVLAIVLLSIAAYANTFQNDFVWDDRKFIQDNLKIRSLNNVPGFFLETVDGLYRPLRTTLYAITYSVWGDNKFGYHLNSLLWHSAVSVLVFLIVSKLTAHRFIPLVSALIFAVHPIHHERVAFMTGGFDLLGAFFLLASFYFYMLFSNSGKRHHLAASAAIFILALFASEEALVLPLIILLYEFIFSQLRFDAAHRKKIIPAAAFFIVASAFFVFRLVVIGVGARASEYVTGSFLTTALTMPKVFLYYLYLVFIPRPLALYREIETVAAVFNPMLLLSIIILAALIFLAVKYRQKNKLLAFSVGWFFITLLPFSNILPIQTLMADRYLYLPSLAAAIAYSYFLFKIKKRWLSLALSLAVIMLFLFLTVDKNLDWKNDIVLWETTSETSPETSVVWSNLGFAHEQGSRLFRAEQALVKAIALDPKNEKAHYNLGIVYMRQKNYGSAVDEFISAIASRPDYAMAYDSLGLAYYYSSLENPDNRALLIENAEAAFIRAIAADPDYYKSYSDLGMLRAQQGSFTEAVALFRKSTQLNPWNHEAYYNLGILYEAAGEIGLVEKNFMTAARLQPENALYREKLDFIYNVGK